MRIFLVLGLMLAGCAGVSPATRAAFEAFDPFTADFTGVSALIEAPDTYDDGAGDVVLTFSAEREDGVLVRADVPLLRERVEAVEAAGRKAFRYRVPEAGAAEISAVQAEMRKWRDARQKGTGTLNVATAGCEDAGAHTADVDVWLQLEADGPLLPVQSGPVPVGPFCDPA